MTETIFIDADKGGVVIFKGAGNKVARATTAKTLAYALDTHNIFGEVMFCSTMDFATEEGFATNDGARNLWDAAVALRN